MSFLGVCCVPRTPVLLSPQTSSSLETELIYGQAFLTQRQEGRFIKGTVVPLCPLVGGPVSQGYVRAKDLKMSGPEALYKITSLKAPVFSKKNIKSPIKFLLPFGARLVVESSHRDFIRIGRAQYVHQKHIAPAAEHETDFVSVAERHIGLPYIWGGISSDGLDCSGLVQTSLWAIGQGCPRNSGEQKDGLGTPIDLQAPLQRGDLVFWPGHVGIMQDEKQMVHANGFHMRTQSEPLKAAAQRIEKSEGPIIAIKRL
ncbi:MAG: C40 family peptidase [Maricaulaceae bacterium]